MELVLLVLLLLVLLALAVWIFPRKPPPTQRTSLFVPFATKTHLTYDIDLPHVEYTRVYNVDITIKIADFALGDTDVITQDIQEAGEFRVERFFVYDTTWNPRLLPLTQDFVLSTGTQIHMRSDEHTEHDIVLDIIPEPNAYLVGSVEVELTAIYPSQQVLSDFTITRIRP